MFRFFAGVSIIGLLSASPAFAGEEILYQPEPAWVEKAPLEAGSSRQSGNFLIYDEQFRIEGGKLWDYKDLALRIGSPQELAQAGTINAAWLPDKGDLTIHEISIIRDGKAIDVVGQGEKLQILRREQDLERRMLDGMLTATLAVPGLKVGDTLRLRFSTTVSDQALGDEVQQTTYLPRKPDFRANFGRVRASWPEGDDIKWKASRGVEVAAPVTRDGYKWLEMALPLEKPDEMPMDAPLRFQAASLLQVGTFADWREVSAVMAPYYHTVGSIEQGSDLAHQVELLKNGQSGELERAVAALKLVQNDVAYLLNGLNGGNYIPQSPSQTWQLRYGDCKAKSLLLLALLREMGIEAEAVTVSIGGGDGVPDQLPIPGAFDHVIVRATIGGNTYWLDGTGSGANLHSVGNVPPFRYALPVRDGGAELVPIVQVLPRVPEGVLDLEFDQTAGADVPDIYKAKLHLYGPTAAAINAARPSATEDQLYDLMNRIVSPFVGSSLVSGYSFDDTADESEVVLTVSGVVGAQFDFDGARGEMRFGLPGNNIAFSPDRARRQWRDIPVLRDGPSATDITVRYRLPDGGKGYLLTGPATLDQTVLGIHQKRKATLEGGVLTISEQVNFPGGEVAPENIAEMKKQASGLSRNELVLRTPEGALRRWAYAGKSNRKELANVEAAFTHEITRKPNEAGSYVNRANFREGTYDFTGALADLDKAIELEPSADLYVRRAGLQENLGHIDLAMQDATEAYDLVPEAGYALALARLLALSGQTGEATDLLEQQGGDEELRRSIAVQLAFVDGMAGTPEEGLGRLDTLLAERPDDAQLLNAKCWHMGAWRLNVDQSIPVCTRAVELARNSAPVLDSRALVYLRAGNLDQALADVNAALAANPQQNESLYLRGFIRIEKGDKGGKDDISDALARSPSLKSEYAHYGFTQ